MDVTSTADKTTRARPSPKRANDVENATYNLAEVAAKWGISYTTAHKGAQAGTLPVTPIRIGRQYLFPKAIVDRLLGIEQ